MLSQSSSFYVNLSSSRSHDVFRDNKPNSFKNQLPRELKIDGDWEVGITELSYPSSLNSFDKPIRIEFIVYRMDDGGQIKPTLFVDSFHGTTRKFSIPLQYNFADLETNLRDLIQGPMAIRSIDTFVIVLPAGRYTIPTFVETFQKLLATEVRKLIPHNPIRPRNYPTFPLGNLFKFSYLPLSNRFHSKLDFPFLDVVYFNEDDAAKVFGLPPVGENGFALEKVSEDFTFPYAASLRTANTLYCYSDIVDYELVGDALGPLLRAIDVTGEQGEIVHLAYDKPYYKRVSKSTLPSIEIQINSETGKEVNFTSVQVECTLNFRKLTR